MTCINLPNLNNPFLRPNLILNVPFLSPIKYDTSTPRCPAAQYSLSEIALDNDNKLAGLIASDFASVQATLRPQFASLPNIIELGSDNRAPKDSITCNIIKSRMLSVEDSICSLSVGEYQSLHIANSWLSNSNLQLSDVLMLIDSGFQSGSFSVTAEGSGTFVCADTFSILHSEIFCDNMLALASNPSSRIDSCVVNCSNETLLYNTLVKDSTISSQSALIASECSFINTQISLGQELLTKDYPIGILNCLKEIVIDNRKLMDLVGVNYEYDTNNNIIGAEYYFPKTSPIQTHTAVLLNPPVGYPPGLTLAGIDRNLPYFDSTVSYLTNSYFTDNPNNTADFNKISIPQISFNHSGLISNLFINCSFGGEQTVIDDPILLCSSTTTVEGLLEANNIIIVDSSIIQHDSNISGKPIPSRWSFSVGAHSVAGRSFHRPAMTPDNELIIQNGGSITADGIVCGRINIGSSASLTCHNLYYHVDTDNNSPSNHLFGSLELRDTYVVLSNLGIRDFFGTLKLANKTLFMINFIPLGYTYKGTISCRGYLEFFYVDQSHKDCLSNASVFTNSMKIHQQKKFNPKNTTDRIEMGSTHSNDVSVTDCRCHIYGLVGRNRKINPNTAKAEGSPVSIFAENAILRILSIEYATQDGINLIELKNSDLSIGPRAERYRPLNRAWQPEQDFILSNINAVNSNLSVLAYKEQAILQSPSLEECNVWAGHIYEGSINGRLSIGSNVDIVRTTVPVLQAATNNRIADSTIGSGLGTFRETEINYSSLPGRINCDGTTTMNHCGLEGVKTLGGTLIFNSCSVTGLHGVSCGLQFSDSYARSDVSNPDLYVAGPLKYDNTIAELASGFEIHGDLFEAGGLDIKDSSIMGGGTFGCACNIEVKNSTFNFKRLQLATWSDVNLTSSSVGGTVAIQYTPPFGKGPSACATYNDGPLRCKEGYGNITLSNCPSTPIFKVEIGNQRSRLTPRRPTHESLKVTYNNCRVNDIDNVHTVVVRGGSIADFSTIECNTIYLYNTTIEFYASITAENVYIYNSTVNGTLVAGNLNWNNSVAGRPGWPIVHKQGPIWLLRPGYDVKLNPYIWISNGRVATRGWFYNR